MCGAFRHFVQEYEHKMNEEEHTVLKIFLASHGRFASGLQSSCGILLGACDNLTVFDAYVDQSTVQEHLDAFYAAVEPEDEVLLCSDMYGGSVNQVMFTYLDRPNTRLVAGVNMSFMMTVLGEDAPLSDQALDEIIQDARECLRRVEPEGGGASSEEDFF